MRAAGCVGHRQCSGRHDVDRVVRVHCGALGSWAGLGSWVWGLGLGFRARATPLTLILPPPAKVPRCGASWARLGWHSGVEHGPAAWLFSGFRV